MNPKDATRAGVRYRWMDLAPAGAADLTGIHTSGVRIEIEVKSATGRQSPEQKCWAEMIRTRGGIYVLARSVSDAQEQLAVLLPS